jgi:disulfide bond formation protein DsbB
MLISAYAFEYIGGLAPCQMCYWQRWTHFAVLGLGIAGLMLPRVKLMSWLIILALLTCAAMASYHAGVEYGWWEGPKTCLVGDAADPTGIETGSLFENLDTPIKGVDCSKPAWMFLGISMAGWNALASFGATILALLILRKDPKG